MREVPWTCIHADHPYARGNRDIIHRSNCKHAANALPWCYAAEFTDEQLTAELTAAPWLRACRVCKPGVSK